MKVINNHLHLQSLETKGAADASLILIGDSDYICLTADGSSNTSDQHNVYSLRPPKDLHDEE
ncbi:hypothetical protein B0H94_101207 [Salsuginibacillus halophilus]|uniref:Spore germination protein PD n=1 Tax=Salsuginibacillus halophilus TaxID=517424 RepID=A0A2P8HYQ3_9BACI|nr:hypothetical protein [Salsuginibacillus halophilus]PSL51294.1 hypothetical protein B0H94_101207 [Salsuginibacillus halophilus]